MKMYILIFLSQAIFGILKTYEIKFTYEKKLKPLLLNSILINVISLIIAYFSLDGLFNGDYLVIPFYIIGGLVGKWLSMREYKF